MQRADCSAPLPPATCARQSLGITKPTKNFHLSLVLLAACLTRVNMVLRNIGFQRLSECTNFAGFCSSMFLNYSQAKSCITAGRGGGPVCADTRLTCSAEGDTRCGWACSVTVALLRRAPYFWRCKGTQIYTDSDIITGYLHFVNHWAAVKDGLARIWPSWYYQ
jgi:hypothetical protein